MKSYRHILFQTCMVDLIFAFISGFTVPQIETTDIRVYFRTSSPWYPQYGLWPCFAMWIYMFALLAILWSMIIQALFRFYIIVKRVTPNGARTWIFQGLIFLLGMSISSLYLCIPCQNINLSDNDALKDMELWRDYPELIYSFRSLPIQDFWFIFYVVLMFALTITANAAFFVSNFKVAKTLNSKKIHFSPQTLRIHKQFGRRVILQVSFKT
uniref:Uncharacterized protein n=1 Tax=Panagrolaimus sp. PS1159 TaxID=55785 RepID=A0AC35FZ50_9BILA